ncbi:MAG: glycosyltransferase [Selenomonadaceae bacterium]|nr:glycosyltransferase [Selenomonadaceae bacterium]
MHTGYSAEVSKEKAERNARLLLQELEETKEPGNLYMYLAESYDGLGDALQAVKYARMDVALGRRKIVYASRSWRILLRYLALDPSAHEERLAFAGKAVRDFPELPEFHAEYAECLAAAWNFPEAIREAEAVGRLFSEHPGNAGIEPVMFDGRMLDALERRCEEWKRILVRSQELRVTSCLIVRNAEKDMGSWLENTMQFSEERIVMDTGSEDRTRDIAVSAGCMVQEFSWNQDFSAARNAALSHATGDWISVMDADEAYEKPGQVKTFLAWIEERHPEAEAVIVPLVNVDEDAANREIGRDMVLRFFRNGRGLRYEGNVHEQLCRFDGSNPCIFQERQKVLLRHWGYSSRRVFAKAQRNLDLLEEDIALHGEGPRHYRYLADCFSTLGNWEKVAFYARKAIMAPLQSVVPDSRMQHLLLAALRKLDAPFSEQEKATREMCEAFPEKPEFPGLLGILLAEQGREKEAVPLLETALDLAEKADATGLPSDFADDAGTVCAWLALAYGNCGRREEGCALLEKALRFSSQEDDVLNAAREMKKELLPEAFLRWLGEWIPDSVESALFLARWAERNGHADLLSHLRGQMEEVYHRSLPRAELYEEAFAGRAEQLGVQATAGLVQDIPFLLKTMLLVEREKEPGWQELLRQCREVLPDVLRSDWRAFEGQQETLSEEGFRIFWPIVRNAGDHVQKERFAMLSFGLGEQVWRPLAVELMADGSW